MDINLQDNLKYFLTNEIQGDKRIFKIVDGTVPFDSAKVFHTGLVKNLGESDSDFVAMGKEAKEKHCDWFAKNRSEVKRFYKKQH